MPRYRYREPEHPTPFARVLTDFMWSQRPPLSAGQVAVKLGNISRQTVHSWLYEGKTPSISNALDALDRLGIPLQQLVEAYEQQEREQQQAAPGHPSPYSEKREFQTPPLDVWLTTIERTERAMRELGMDDHTIAAVITRIQEQQRGMRPYQRHIEAEHAADTAATQPAPSADSQNSPLRQQQTSKRKTPAPSGPRGGRRGSSDSGSGSGGGNGQHNGSDRDTTE